IPNCGILITNTDTEGDSYSVDLGNGGSSYTTIINCDITGNNYTDLETGAENRCYSSSSGGGIFVSNRVAHCTLRNALTLASTIYQRGFIFEDNQLRNSMNLWQAFGCTNVV